jgi:hypothetical protein
MTQNGPARNRLTKALVSRMNFTASRHRLALCKVNNYVERSEVQSHLGGLRGLSEAKSNLHELLPTPHNSLKVFYPPLIQKE